jgi:hypothetical protein
MKILLQMIKNVEERYIPWPLAVMLLATILAIAVGLST